MAQSLQRRLATAVTAGNLLCGIAVIVLAIEGRPLLAAWFIAICILLDSVDGRVARRFGSTSMGKELDSMADLVSFGVAPGILLYTHTLSVMGGFGAAVAAVYTFCCAYRLARFNVDSDSSGFIGLPSTMAGGAAAAWVLSPWSVGPWLSLGVLLLLATLMVSPAPYGSLAPMPAKKWALILTGIGGAMLVFQLTGFPGGIFLGVAVYVIWGPMVMAWEGLRGGLHRSPAGGR